jgi:hypothetical protein
VSGVEGWKGRAVDRLIGATAGQALGVLAALLLGPAGGFVGAAMVPVAEDLSGAMRRLALRKLERVQLAAEEASKQAGCDFADLVLRSLDDDLRAGLLSAAFEAAANAGDGLKVKALGRAYARGALAADDAQVDEQMRIVGTLGALDAADIRVLDRMTSSPVWVLEGAGTAVPSVAESVPGTGAVVHSVMSRLSTLGLVAMKSTGLDWGNSPAMWEVTRFGSRCLEALREAGTEVTEEPR